MSLYFIGDSYQNRYWRKIVFDGVAKIRQSLDEAYGVDKVSITSATFRWMNHHSAMRQNGESHENHVIICITF